MEPRLLLESETEDGVARLVLIAVDDMAAACAVVARLQEGAFAILLVVDATTIESSWIVELAEICIAQGLFWLSAWGPGCERVHDLFDGVDIERLEGAKTYDPVMTTWHDDEELPETLSFFWHGAFADAARSSGSLRLVLTVALPSQAEHVAALASAGLD